MLQDDGQFVMYYSASLRALPDKHCVGVAISSTPEGPFQPIGDVPLICPNPDARGYNANPIIGSPGVGGAIDASGFRDVDGKLYIVYKVDGNAVGSGGSCNNGDGRQSTPLMLVAVAADGFSPIGSPVQLLDRIEIDGPLVEAPNLVRTPDGQYNLFFSSNCYSTPDYDVSWATSQSLFGPYDRRGPLFTTGVNGLVAPGGASIAKDGVHMAFHADFGHGRAMYTNRISGVRDSIRLVD
jgi:beta-xylosidase